MTAAEILTDKIASLTTETLADVCVSLMNDMSDEADAVFSRALAECQRRMSSAQFLALCGRMEAAA